MAPLNQPQNLVNLCTEVASKWLSLICQNLEQKNGNYDNEITRSEAATIGNVLNDTLIQSMLENLIEFESELCQPEPSFDQRIKASILFQPQVTKLVAYGFTWVEDVKFWGQKISEMKGLKTVKLDMEAKDEILEALANSCPQLEAIEIILARQRKKGNKSPTYTMSNQTLNALKKCSKLKKIKILWEPNGTTKFPIDLSHILIMDSQSLAELLLSCPELQHISIHNMGELLHQIKENNLIDHSLNLSYFGDVNLNSFHARDIEHFCPSLRHISLDGAFYNANFNSTVLLALADSPLKLEVVELKFFEDDENFEYFLLKKGSNLRSLAYNTHRIRNIEYFKFFRVLGENCPNLERLELSIRIIKYDILQDSEIFSSQWLKLNLFKELKSVLIKAYSWDARLALFLILCNAHKIESICLIFWKYYSLDFISELMLKLLNQKSLNKLITLEFGMWFDPLTSDVSDKLIDECPNLKKIILPNFNYIPIEEYNEFNEEMKKKNRDFRYELIENSELMLI